MVGEIFGIIFYNPLYNGLVFLIAIVPYADVGIAVILLTVLVKILMSPLSVKSLRTQTAVRELEVPLKEIKEKHKDNPQEQAKETMALYKEKKVNPFASILLIFIQLPIVFALYWVFFRGGLPVINLEILYSFIPVPSVVNMEFLGFFDVGGRSILFATLAGLSQFLHAQLAMPKYKPKNPSGTSMKEDLARSFNIQFRYVLPVTIGVISYFLSAALALYWLTSNIVSILEQLYIRRKKK